MDILSVLSLVVLFSPYTVSTTHLLCNKGKCPKVNCFVGWQYKGWDMNGRLYTSCKSYTTYGQKLKDIHDKVKDFI